MGVPVALRKQERDQMNPRPDLFTLQFPNQVWSAHSLTLFVHQFRHIGHLEFPLKL